MAYDHGSVGITIGHSPEGQQDRATRAVPTLVLAGAYLALLSSCAPTPTARPPLTEPLVAMVAEVPTAGPTIAARAARYDVTTQQVRPTAEPSPTASAISDYLSGYPHHAQAPKARADGSLQSFLALDTGPYLANHNVHELTWTNNSGRLLAVYKAYLWTGVDKGAIGDVHVEARRASDNSYIGILQWDHYVDPTVPQHGQQFDYPSPMLLDPGDGIVIKHLANGFAPGWHAHHVLILWVK
jgi:hypothetical protein